MSSPRIRPAPFSNRIERLRALLLISAVMVVMLLERWQWAVTMEALWQPGHVRDASGWLRALCVGGMLLIPFLSLRAHPGRHLLVNVGWISLYGLTWLVASRGLRVQLPLFLPIFALIMSDLMILGVNWLEEREKRQKLEVLEHNRQQFVDMLVHDLKGRIGTLNLAVARLAERTRACPEFQPDMDHLNASGDRLMVLVQALLDVRRIEENRLTLYRQVVDLAALVDQVVRHAEPAVASFRCRLEWNRPPPEARLEIRTDPGLVVRILENLVWNALHHGKRERAIRLELSRTAQHAILQVSNEGKIIPARQQDQLFDMFSTEGAVGTGIGLSFCRLAAEALDGELGLRSPAPDRADGVMVTLKLPLETTA